MQRVEAVGIDAATGFVKLTEALGPRCAGVRLVEAKDVDELLPERGDRALVVEPGVHEPRPLRSRPRNDAPVRRPRVDHVEGLARRRQLIHARTFGIDSVEQPRRDDRRDRDPGAMLFADGEQATAVPRRHEVERVRGCSLEADPLDLRVEVPGVDESRATVIRRARERAGKRRGTRLGDDPHDLTTLDIGAGLDDEPGVPGDQFVVHAARRLLRPPGSPTLPAVPPPLTRSSEAEKESNVSLCRHIDARRRPR